MFECAYYALLLIISILGFHLMIICLDMVPFGIQIYQLSLKCYLVYLDLIYGCPLSDNISGSGTICNRNVPFVSF